MSPQNKTVRVEEIVDAVNVPELVAQKCPFADGSLYESHTGLTFTPEKDQLLGFA